MDISIDYNITFADGKQATRHYLFFPEISDEEYRLVVRGIVDGYDFMNIPGNEELIGKLNYLVDLNEQTLSINGRFLDKPLKTPRTISSIEYFLPSDQLTKIQAFKNCLDLLDKPEEQMTMYRSDGSYVTFRSKFGMVWITDSRHPNTISKESTDLFLKDVGR